jgi:hypothetical protein
MHMPRRILGALLWLALLPLVGAFRLVWHSLTVLARLQPKTLLVLVGLAVALSTPNPVSAQLDEAGIWPPGHVILGPATLVLGVFVLYHGLRSRWLGRLGRGALSGGD